MSKDDASFFAVGAREAMPEPDEATAMLRFKNLVVQI